ncbi:Uncharacterised protein [Klebsiella pneumoniae]|nr:Uncharacterised protein [Klebsiella pneumoniae]
MLRIIILQKTFNIWIYIAIGINKENKVRVCLINNTVKSLFKLIKFIININRHYYCNSWALIFHSINPRYRPWLNSYQCTELIDIAYCY